MAWSIDPVTLAANLLLLSSAAPGYWRWRRAARRPAEAQQARLLAILKANANTAFGRAHQFNRISSVEEYRRAIPLSSYGDYELYIPRIASGESNVLTAAPVINLTPSSGSTAASKLIPYTEALKSEFQAGIDPWLFSLFLAWPGLLKGKQYWSITPSGQTQRRSAGGVPIGFEQETEYFGPVKRRIIEALWAIPPAVNRIQHGEAFRYVVLLFLLRCRDLALVSVWNPTFFMLILGGLKPWRRQLLSDLAQGSLSPPAELSPDVYDELQRWLRPAPRRARELAALLEVAQDDLAAPAGGRRTIGELIWPQLRVISCWADGPAQPLAGQLRQLFPNVALQPKGLLATEGMVSFPLGNLSGGVLSLNSHFLEFIPAEPPGSAGEPVLAHQLELGAAYTITLTTGGGLYRYQLGDLTRVTGFERGCPLVRFEGRNDAVVDLFGEKLNEAHVRAAGQKALAETGLAPDFWMLAPERQGDCQGHYTLFAQGGLPPQGPERDAALRDLALALDTELQKNFHYRHCRQLGQLTDLQAVAVSPELGDANQLYLAACVSLGQRLGDVKPAVLSRRPELAAVLAGRGLEDSVSGRP